MMASSVKWREGGRDEGALEKAGREREVIVGRSSYLVVLVVEAVERTMATSLCLCPWSSPVVVCVCGSYYECWDWD